MSTDRAKKRKSKAQAEVAVVPDIVMVEDSPQQQGYQPPVGFRPVRADCPLDISGLEEGRHELWLIQLPPQQTVAMFKGLKSLQVTLSSKQPQVASFSVADADFSLVQEPKDLCRQMAVAVPRGQHAQAQLLPVARRVTVVSAVPDDLQVEESEVVAPEDVRVLVDTYVDEDEAGPRWGATGASGAGGSGAGGAAAAAPTQTGAAGGGDGEGAEEDGGEQQQGGAKRKKKKKHSTAAADGGAAEHRGDAAAEEEAQEQQQRSTSKKEKKQKKQRKSEISER